MQRIFSLVFVSFMLLSVPVYGETAAADSPLTGNWTSNSYNGVFTQLEIEANGRFVFREQHSRDLRRSYMCGSLTDQGDALDLLIQQQKERSRSGAIVQAVGDQQDKFAIRSRSDKRLVIVIDSRTVVLERG